MRDEIYIQETIKNLKNLQIKKETLDAKIKEEERRLKEYMNYYCLEELYGEQGEKVIYKEVLGKRFDSKEFKKSFEPLYNSFLKVTKNQRFKFSY